ncbi:MAG: hypothetical protein L0211_00315 [Planctomycetaceae bacterium]|nr:hypothetical protein [Planctomycetaceae bacterium]
MSLKITCSKCAHTLKAKDQLAGKKVMCPKCQAILTIPAKPGAPATPAPRSFSTSRSTAGTAAPPTPSISREQILAAFQGQFALPRVSFGRRLGTLLVLAVLFVLVLVYLAMLVGVGWLIYWLATHDFASSIPPAGVTLALAAAVFALLCLLRPLFMPQQRPHKEYALQEAQAPALVELIAQIAKRLDAPPPAAIQVECSPRLAIDRAGRKLTIGLGLVAGLTVQQLAGLIAGLVAQNRRSAPSGQTNLIRAINGWLWRSVYQADRFERWITRVNLRPGIHLGRLVLPLRPLSFLARAALWIPMFIGNTVAAALVRRTEFDADVCSARLVGKQTFAQNIQWVKIIEYTWEGILPELAFLYKEQCLPDSLPHELAARLREITPELATALIQSVIKAEEIPFDSRPSDEERLSVVAAEPASGAMKCPLPASALWTDFGKLARDTSFDYYSAAFGAQHLKTALRPAG